MTNQNREKTAGSPLVYVGTYTNNGGQGIYLCQLNSQTGELRQIGVAGYIDNPSYFVLDSVRPRLFAVNETLEFEGRPGGSISAFTIEPSSGQLTLVNKVSSHGGAPCYLTLDQSGRFLFVANYVGGNIALFPIGPDGALGEVSEVKRYTGHSQHPTRQEAPHPHSVILDPLNRFAFVPDLGTDRVMQYRFDSTAGRLTAHKPPWIETPPGSGPRHMVFHPTLKRAYIINELNSTITGYVYDDTNGWLTAMQTIATIPQGNTGPNIAAAIHLSPDGRFLYGSNRGHDTIAGYAVDLETGRLTLIGYTPTQGKKPRGFAIDPTGTILLAANQDSHNIVTYWIDPDRGLLVPTGHKTPMPSPVCLKFLPKPGVRKIKRSLM